LYDPLRICDFTHGGIKDYEYSSDGLVISVGFSENATVKIWPWNENS